jgi:WD40 repeat protein
MCAAKLGVRRTVFIWEVETGKQTLKHGVQSVAFSSDGQWIASDSHDETACVWNSNTGQPIGLPPTRNLYLLALNGMFTEVDRACRPLRIASVSKMGTVSDLSDSGPR